MKLSVVFEYFDKATAPMKRTERSLKSFRKSIDFVQSCLGKFNQTAALMGRLGDTMGQWMQPGVEFEQSMANLSVITGIAGKDLERLGKIARETGVSSGLGASSAIEAFTLLASQIDVSKIGMDGLIELQSKTITLAQASGMSMTEAVNSMTGTINRFGLQADQAGRVINVLAAGSKYGAAEIPQLAESLNVVGAAANAAGLSVESTAGAIGVLSKNNLKGAEAGMVLQNIVLKMQTAMGVDFSKTSLQEALIELKPHLKDATYLSELFGRENVAAAQFLVANTDLLGEMTTRITDTQVAQEQAAIRTNTWSQRLKEQTARFNDWMIGLQQGCGGILYAFQILGQGASMLVTLTSVGKMFIGIGKEAWGAGLGIVRFGRTLKMLSLAKNTGSAFAFARAVASCGVMGRVAAVGIHLWSQVTKVAGLVQGGFMKILQGVRLVMMTSVVPALWGVIAATWAWTTSLLANPITWLVLAVGALVAAIVVCWQKFAGFRAVIYTIWDAIKGFGMAIFNWLVTPLKMVWKIFSGLGKALFKLFTGDFKGAAEEFTGAFKDGFKEGVEGVKKTVNGVKDTVTGISGNYEMHLTEERAKQGEKKRQKKSGVSEVKPASGGVTGIQVIEPKNVSENSGQESVVMNVENSQTPSMPEMSIVEQSQYAEMPEVVSASGETADVEVVQPEKVQDDSSQKMPVVNVENSKTPSLSEMSIVEQSQYAEMPEVVSASGETADVGVVQPKKVQDGSSQKMPVVSVENSKISTLPEIKAVAPSVNFSDASRLENQISSIRNGQMNDNRQSINTHTRNQAAKVEIHFQPNINVSAELTQKTKDDFLRILRDFGDEITRMVEEVQRRNGRGAYAIS